MSRCERYTRTEWRLALKYRTSPAVIRQVRMEFRASMPFLKACAEAPDDEVALGRLKNSPLGQALIRAFQNDDVKKMLDSELESDDNPS